MREIERRPAAAGVLGTLAFWLVLAGLFTLYSLFFKQEEYKSIQINLANFSDRPVSENMSADSSRQQSLNSAPPASNVSESVSEDVPAAAVQKAVQAPVVPEKPAPAKIAAAETIPAKRPEAKKTQAKETSESSAPAPVMSRQVLQEDPFEAFNKLNAKKTDAASKAEFDWSQFDDEPVVKESVVTGRTAANSLSGNAATASDGDPRAGKSGGNGSSAGKGAAASGAPENVYPTTYTSEAGGPSSSITVVGGSGSDRKFYMQMENKSLRKLESPASLSLGLSKKAGDQIDSQREVTIRFVIRADGSVPAENIVIPASLPGLVRSEIIKQMVEWHFSVAQKDDSASFRYIIKTR